MEYRYGSHTVFQIEYHFVWVTKYRYKVLNGVENGKWGRIYLLENKSAPFLPCNHIVQNQLAGEVHWGQILLFANRPL